MPLHDKRARCRAVVVQTACCGLLLLAGQARAEDVQTVQDEAVHLYNAGDFEQSIKVLKRAQGLTEEPRLLGRIHLYIGVNHAVLEQADQAKASFQTALGFDPTLRLDPARFKQQVVDLFDMVRGSLRGELEVTADQPGATVLLDWKPVGQAPFRGQVEIGAHKVAVRTPDGRFGFKGEVVVHLNKLARLAARLEPLKRAEEEQRAQHERDLQLRREAEQRQELHDTTRVRRRKTILGYTALGVGLALALSGVVTCGVAYSQGSDALDNYNKATAEFDPAGIRKDEIAGLRDDVDSANSKLTASYVLLGLGTAALGYSLYELLTRPAESREASREHRVGISAGTGGAALSYGFRF